MGWPADSSSPSEVGKEMKECCGLSVKPGRGDASPCRSFPAQAAIAPEVVSLWMVVGPPSSSISIERKGAGLRGAWSSRPSMRGEWRAKLLSLAGRRPWNSGVSGRDDRAESKLPDGGRRFCAN